MQLPELTHLQFLILTICLPGRRTGRQIREELAKQGTPKTGPAFYQLMGRLEDERFVKGWYKQKIVDGQIIKERHYEITAKGLKACECTRDFYTTNLPLPLGVGIARA